MTSIPSPARLQPALPRRTALALTACLLGACAWPAPAGAVLLWKRGARKQAPVQGDATQPRDGRAKRIAPLAGGSLALSAASALGAPETLPSPAEVANYPHELRLLTNAHAELGRASSDTELAHALVDYGNVLAKLNRDGPASRAYAEALGRAPGLQPAWNNLGSLLRRRGHHELAIAVFRSVLSEDPEAGLAWFNLAMSLEARDDWDGADDAYLQALMFSPELWIPAENPIIIGNRRAQLALHHRYLAHDGRGSIYLDTAR